MSRLPDNMIAIYTHILNASLSVRLFPQKYKNAVLKMIPKKGKPNTQVLNYRPISPLEIAAKILEQIINDTQKFHGRKYKITLNIATGNTAGHKTATAILCEHIASSQQRSESNAMQCRFSLCS